MGRMLLPLVVVGAALAAGCSQLPTVQPWEKGHLARPEMTFESNALESRYTEHMYTSKESSSGGVGVGGGGCGCN